jgi:hypothetical protein
MPATMLLFLAALAINAFTTTAAMAQQEPGTNPDGTPTLYTQCTMNPGLCGTTENARAAPHGSVFGDEELDARLNEALGDTFACVFGFRPCVNRSYPDRQN